MTMTVEITVGEMPVSLIDILLCQLLIIVEGLGIVLVDIFAMVTHPGSIFCGFDVTLNCCLLKVMEGLTRSLLLTISVTQECANLEDSIDMPLFGSFIEVLESLLIVLWYDIAGAIKSSNVILGFVVSKVSSLLPPTEGFHFILHDTCAPVIIAGYDIHGFHIASFGLLEHRFVHLNIVDVLKSLEGFVGHLRAQIHIVGSIRQGINNVLKLLGIEDAGGEHSHHVDALQTKFVGEGQEP